MSSADDLLTTVLTTVPKEVLSLWSLTPSATSKTLPDIQSTWVLSLISTEHILKQHPTWVGQGLSAWPSVSELFLGKAWFWRWGLWPRRYWRKKKEKFALNEPGPAHGLPGPRLPRIRTKASHVFKAESSLPAPTSELSLTQVQQLPRGPVS